MLITVIIPSPEPSVGSPPMPPVRMWNDTGQSALGERGPHRVEALLGVVALGGHARHHRAAQPGVARPLDLVDRRVGIDRRDHREPDQPALAAAAQYSTSQSLYARMQASW